MERETRNRFGGLLAAAGVTLSAGLVASFLARRRAWHGDDAPGYTQPRSFGDYDVTGRSVTIREPRQKLYEFWRDFANLPRFMENLEEVRQQGDDGDSVWVIKAPAGRSVEVETKIAREEPGELIAWRSVEGSDIDTEGRVTFEDAPGERGTRVKLIIAYKPPAGEVGKRVAKLFQREPAIQARHDLKRFKMLMETGEIATSARTADQTRAAQQENG
ncbi:SRPBCC family protein [Alteriqipengyuania flavescens]|uniref:SRPBCC family protein n=1 Tax=Alteriqipengyuania flavescens TaxID=3053610 RepID=UPI0025B28198|nr:SRPBCC family protein [Alteriqipengyuania flavescens]WJY19876.1 SRPBCC family protein [Alteriqipengyuania flavescens]WJY25818.1 SRPBCC family protein [Alteriqipengyuania flavescens]